MRADERDSLRRLFRYRCGYCGVAESDAGAQLTLDHFQPRSRGGADRPDNWVYCCHPCNEFKGDFWPNDPTLRLLHPLVDDPAAHLTEDHDGSLHPLTARGAAHIDRLHLNRPQLVAYRRERRAAAEAQKSQARLLEALSNLEEQMRSLIEELAKFRGR
jgi:hypothetical protein